MAYTISLRELAVNTAPLSETMISGWPQVAKVDRSFVTVISVATALTQWLSIHLDCASKIRRNILPRKGPA